MTLWPNFDFSQFSWFFPVFVIAFSLVANVVIYWVTGVFRKKAQPHKRVWQNAFITSLDRPLRLLVWIIGLSVLASWFAQTEEWQSLRESIPTVRSIFIILTLSWFSLRFINRLEDNFKARAEANDDQIDPTAADAMSKLAWVTIFIMAMLSILQTLGVSVTSLLAFGGAAGIAVGFAAQSLVANMLGGLTVFATRIFKIGDYIILPGTELKGRVEHIGWRATKVIGFDRKPFYVPNATFNNTTIINHSRMSHRRIEQIIHLRYEDIDKVEAIVQQGTELIKAHSEIDQNFFVFRFDSYGHNSLKLLLYAFTSNDYGDYMRVKEEILLGISKIVAQQGGKLSMPMRYHALPEGLPTKEQHQSS